LFFARALTLARLRHRVRGGHGTRAYWGFVSAPMAPDPYVSSVRLIPAPGAMAHLSKEEVCRFFYKTSTSAQFQGAQAPEDALCENLRDIHEVGRRDSKYMKYQSRQAPLWDRSLCEHTRAYHAHDLSGGKVTAECADLIKSKQGVGRAKTQPAFDAKTKYTDDFKGFSRAQARGAKREPYIPIIPCDDQGRPSHPLRGTDRMEETCSHEHQLFIIHPLELAKATKAVAPPANIGPVADCRPHLVAQTTAYREEFFSDKGCPRRPLRKPTRCKSAPTLRGPAKDFPRWMRQSVETGCGIGGGNWAASRVQPQPPLSGSTVSRARPVSASAIGRSSALERQSSVSRARPPSASGMSAGAQRPRRPVSAGAIGSRSGVGSGVRGL